MERFELSTLARYGSACPVGSFAFLRGADTRPEKFAECRGRDLNPHEIAPTAP